MVMVSQKAGKKEYETMFMYLITRAKCLNYTGESSSCKYGGGDRGKE
jgi:hypothetical protein